MKNNLKILITGGTSGIGLYTTEKLLEAGHQVVSLGRNPNNVLQLTEKYPNQFTFLVKDLTDSDKFNDIFENSDRFDGFIGCAGREETIPFRVYSKEKIVSLFDINLFANIELLRHFSLKKNSNDGSSVIIISSVMSILGQKGKVGYCSSKSAILGLVKSAALELSARKIRVNAISPGVVKTPMTDNLFSQLSSENISQIKSMHPLGIGNVDDIYNALEFLLSPKSKWITGQNLIIDGGYSIS